MPQELDAEWVGRNQRIDGDFQALQPFEASHWQLFYGIQIYLTRKAENGRGFHRFPEFEHQRVFALHRIGAALARTIDRQCFFQRRKDVGIVDDHTAVLAGEHAIGPRDGLHQRVIPHRLIEIHR